MDTYTLKKTDLNHLLNRATVRNRRLESFSSVTDEREFVPTVGFHVYADIRLKLQITAGEHDQHSQRYLQILQDCATAADECSGIAGAKLLEVQADKMHFIIEEVVANEKSIARLLAFCAAFTARIFEQIMPRDPQAWRGFAMAADHGPAVIIQPNWDTTDSVVSLGVAANTPAKRLYQTPTVPSGYVAFNENMPRPNNNDLSPVWKETALYQQGQNVALNIDESLNERMTAAISNRLSTASTQQVIALSAASDFLTNFGAGKKTPTRVQGFFKRADLDGFTAKVKAAFAQKTDDAIEKLLKEFYQAMTRPHDFKGIMKKRDVDVLQLPWAGDCSNLVMFAPTWQTYQAARSHLPFAAALAWQEMENGTGRDWAVAVGGGGNEESEGSNGTLLIGHVAAGQRTFLVAAGWGAQRSHDAQQSDGLRGTETVLHENDVAALQNPFSTAFKGSALFRKATLADMKKAQKESVDALAASKPVTVPNVITKAPASRPYFDSAS